MRLIAAVFVALLLGCGAPRPNLVKQGHDAAMKEDFAGAIELWTVAARQGDPMAIYNLGVLAEHGAGMPADRAAAIQLYTLAAQSGNSDARLRLAQLGAPVPERRQIDPNVLLLLMMHQNQINQQNANTPIVPPLHIPRTPPTYNTDCTRIGQFTNCTSRPQ